MGKDVDPELWQDFVSETAEHLENIAAAAIELERNPQGEDALNTIFRAFHTIKGLAGFVELDDVQKFAHAVETLLDCCRRHTVKVSRPVIDLILFASDSVRALCEEREAVDCNSLLAELDRRIAAASAANRAPGCQPTVPAVNDQGTEEERLDGADDIVRQGKSAGETAGVPVASETTYVRVQAQKLSMLVDLLGELMVIQSQVEQEAAQRYDSTDALINNLGRMARVTKNMQNLSVSLRMIALKSTFQKLERVARDTMKQLDKDVDFSVVGDETEIDRGVAEHLLDPLIHLVKNALDHGIEDRARRIAAGKSEIGHVVLRAYSSRGYVHIEVEDDGGGIDLDRVREKATEKRLIEPGQKMAEDELFDLLFLPGFSTAKKVSEVSGRGVGLDVVKTEVSQAGGRIRVTSTRGKGSLFHLKVPINSTLIDGTLVEIGGQRYIVPTLNIKTIVNPEAAQWVSVAGRRTMLRVRESIIPIVPIDGLLGIPGRVESMGRTVILIVEQDQKVLGLPVANVLGKREIVVKPLGADLQESGLVAGASIMGDGNVSLILDIESLFKMGEEDK
jgi:two-component system chemotaxis sensor kinase CheA